ncbi:TonB-dependent receptor [Sphingomonas sp. SUN019]|uniref:TonB-dependent receptor domain-containing protein n=1 Tax=Sphingomonas sp. SUN019 TaxID=2937788 RepID=UPI002164AEF9|nr:TonB-dependent receptor [Sphingomonas sp. SUN019]UVO49386.1 TonB-dependent receptor [Sphingomonas sp. SUN019]
MLKPISFASLLLVSTSLIAPAAFAQTTAPTSSAPSTATGSPQGDEQTQTATPVSSQPGEDPQGSASDQSAPDVSIPGGGDIVVVGRRRVDVQQQAPQVVSVLSSEDIARTGEGDIAGALQRVTGLSVVGAGFVYVRGLGDRYSLALLNGSPLPSPEPLRRVVPLDIFPTDVIASSLVQKSYSVNFPGEFGGGVINLTTKSTPDEPFVTLSGSVGGDSFTTGNLGYVYYGSPTDWTGFDNGTRDVPGPLQAALDSGKPILAGADFSRADLQNIAISLSNSRTSVVQKVGNMPINFSGNVTGGGSKDVGDVRLGLIASAGIGNTWRTRQTLQQFSVSADLSGPPQTSFDRVVTDNRVVVNGLLGLSAEFGENTIRWTNLYIRDTIKQTRLAIGVDQNQQDRDVLKQDTAWYERQLINSQLVGEFKFGDLDLDLRGGYANSQREAPYERTFTYVRTNTVGDPTGDRLVNDLGGNKGDATIAFSDLNEDLWSGGADAVYAIVPEVKLGIGYAYSDTQRTAVRRAFQFRATNLPVPVQQLRPDYLLSDSVIQNFGVELQETSAQDGTAAFDAGLRTHAGYGQIIAQVLPSLNITAGVRYETAKQTVTAIDLFNSGLGTGFNTNLNNDYFLPAVTLTYELAPEMQFRVSGSKTIARPQFRELIRQLYIDTDSNRTFQGNPSLVDSELTNAEARYEWFFARDQRITLAGFYKKIDRPIETYSSILSSDITTSFANAPEATLYGAELEMQKYFPLDTLGGEFFATRRLALIGNYTYTKSKLKVGADDVTVINGVEQAASNFFRDGAPLTGQSDHIGNIQIGLEDTDHLSQQTLLLSYATKRVTTRGPSGQPDVYEKPGFRLDFVAREDVDLFGLNAEVKFEARNITATKYQEFQEFDGRRIYYNLYDVGASVSLGLGLKF